LCPYRTSPEFPRAFLSALLKMKNAAVCVMVFGCVVSTNAAITNYFNFETAPVICATFQKEARRSGG
jgi:hypothetical protein